MGVARSGFAFVGTDETTLSGSIANNGTLNGSEIDCLGSDASEGEILISLVLTSTATTGAADITVSRNRVTGQSYTAPAPQHSVTPINGTLKVPLGVYKASRYMHVDIKNTGTGASFTASVLAELFKRS